MQIARFERSAASSASKHSTKTPSDLDSMPLGDLLQRLVAVAPKEAEALRVIVIMILRTHRALLVLLLPLF